MVIEEMTDIDNKQSLHEMLKELKKLFVLQVQYYRDAHLDRAALHAFGWEHPEVDSVLTEMDILDTHVAGLIDTLLNKHLYGKYISTSDREILSQLEQYEVKNNPILTAWLNKSNSKKYQKYFDYIVIYGQMISLGIEVLKYIETNGSDMIEKL